MSLAAAFVLAVVGLRLAAPYWIIHYVNKTLDELDGFTGHVDDVELNLWRGAYVIEGIHIEKTGDREPVPFVTVQTMDLSVQWKALLDGAVVAEIELLHPQLNIVHEPNEVEARPRARERRKEPPQTKEKRGSVGNWQDQVKKLVPLKINHVAVMDGELHFRNFESAPKVNVFLRQIEGRVENLTNSEELAETLAARAHFHALAMGSGKLSLDARIDPYTENPNFDLNAKLESLRVKQLNSFLKAYANVDAEAGLFSIYTEVSSRNGRFQGYVKPFLKDLEIIRWKDEEEPFFGKLWEAVVGGLSEVIENHKKDTIASRIPLRGSLDSPSTNTLAAIGSVLKNAFFRALRTGIENKIGPKSG